jgi:hypothetical protein
VLLLSQLPQIKNIEFRVCERNILGHIAVEKLDRISNVRGCVRDINMLSGRCRNITNLKLGTVTVDLSGLTTLTALSTLRVSVGDHATSNLNSVLTAIGPRLTDLTLNLSTHVNLQDIAMLCPSLKILCLLMCSFLPLNPDAPLDPQLPHFRNLISLHIIKRNGDETNYNYIRHYVSLKTIRLYWINIFTVEFMRDVLNSGTFAHLEEFDIFEYENGVLTMEALELLIQRCPHLKSIKFAVTCFRITRRFIQEVKRRVSVRNLHLEITERQNFELIFDWLL